MISDGTCPLLPRRPRHAVRGPLAVRLLGRLPAARRRAGRARAGAPGRPRAARAAGRGESTRRPSSSPTSSRPGYGAVVRGGVSPGRHGRGRRLRAGRADGRALRRRRRRAACIAVDGVPARRELAERSAPRRSSPARAADAVAEATGGLGADVVIEAAGSPGGLDASLAARPRPRRRLGRRRALRAGLSARQRAHVRARADAALLDRRPDGRRRAACSPDWRAASSTRAPSSRTGCRSPTPRRPTASSTRARRRRWCWHREGRDRDRSARRPPHRLRRRGVGVGLQGDHAAGREEADGHVSRREST